MDKLLEINIKGESYFIIHTNNPPIYCYRWERSTALLGTSRYGVARGNGVHVFGH